MLTRINKLLSLGLDNFAWTGSSEAEVGMLINKTKTHPCSVPSLSFCLQKTPHFI